MKAKIRRVEDGVMLVSDEPLFDQLGLDDGADVEVSTKGVMTVMPVRDDERERRFRESAERVLDKHAGLFERLSK